MAPDNYTLGVWRVEEGLCPVRSPVCSRVSRIGLSSMALVLALLHLTACVGELDESDSAEDSSVKASLPAGNPGDLSDQFPPRSWVRLARMNEPRTEVAAAALEGQVYVVGGLGSRSNANEIFDPTTNTWREGADLPIWTHHAWAAAVAGRLYVGDGASDRVFAYDPSTDSWVEVANSKYHHGRTPAVGVIDGRIYVAGGAGGGMRGNEVEAYDPVSDEWMEMAPMSCPRNHSTGGVLDGKLHVAGGRNEQTTNLTCHEAFDPATNTWTNRADLPTGRSGIAGAVAGGLFYVFGGELNPGAPGAVFKTVEAYDPGADAWARMPSMPTGRHGIFGAVIGNTIYLAGGARRISVTGVHEAYVAPDVR